jgi:hypothetical protein
MIRGKEGSASGGVPTVHSPLDRAAHGLHGASCSECKEAPLQDQSTERPGGDASFNGAESLEPQRFFGAGGAAGAAWG